MLGTALGGMVGMWRDACRKFPIPLTVCNHALPTRAPSFACPRYSSADLMKQKTARSRAWNGAALFSLAWLAASPANAANLYWDLDGANPGPGFLDGGIWDISAFNWSLDSTGSSATQAWSNSPGTDIAIFSAGELGAAAGSYTVTLTGTGASDPGAVVGGIVVKDGRVTFGGQVFNSAVSIGSCTVSVGPGS